MIANPCNKYFDQSECNLNSKCSWCNPESLCIVKQTQTCVNSGSSNVAYWTKAADGSWSDKTAWSTGNVPTSVHTVFVSVSRRITVTTQGTIKVKSLTVGSGNGAQQPTLEIASSSTVEALTVLQGATLSVRHHLQWTGTAKVYGTIIWNPYSHNYKLTGGDLNVYGSLVILGSYYRYVYSHIRIYGRGYVKTDGYSLYMTSNKQLQVMSGGYLEAASRGYISRSGSGAQFINDGTFTVSLIPTNNNYYVDISTTSKGFIDVTSGSTLSFRYGATISGNVNVESGAQLQLTGSTAATLQKTSSLTGNGTLYTTAPTTVQSSQLDVGSLKIQGSVSIANVASISSLDLLSGTLTCLSDVTVTSSMQWTGGYVQGPQRLLVLGELNLRTNTRLINGHVVIANRAFTSPYASTIGFSTSGASSITVLPGATWDMSQMSTLSVISQVINNGSLVIAPATMVQISGDIVNGGDITIVRNTLRISGSSLTALNGSSLTVLDDAQLSLSSSKSSLFDLMSNVTVKGRLSLASSKLNVKSKLMRWAGRLVVSHSTLTTYGTVPIQLMNSLDVSYSTVIIDVQSPNNITIGYLYVSPRSTVTLGSGITVNYCRLYGTLEIGPPSGSSNGLAVHVDVLEWSSGTIRRRKGVSGKPQLRVLQYHGTYYTSKYIRSVQLTLLKLFWELTRSSRYLYFQDDADVFVPRGYNVEIATSAYTYWYIQGNSKQTRFTINGNVIVRSSDSSSTYSYLHIRFPLDVRGKLDIVSGTIFLYSSSYITGTLTTKSEGQLSMLSAVHTWTNSSIVDAVGFVGVRSTARLSIGSSAATISTLYVSGSAAFVTVAGILDTVTVKRLQLYNGVFQCSQDCVITDVFEWRGGTVRTSTDNSSVIAGPNCTVTTVSRTYYYVGPGVFLIQGKLSVDSAYYIYLNGQLAIDKDGRFDIYYSMSMASSSSKGALTVHDGGTVRVHHGVRWQVRTPLYNVGEMIVEGYVNLFGYQTLMGYHRGTLTLPVPYGTFATSGNGRIFNLTSEGRVSGVGVIRHDAGTLLINTDLDSQGSFKGSVYLVGGNINIPASTAVNISYVSISSGTLTLANTGTCHVHTLNHIGGALIASGTGRFTISKMTFRNGLLKGTQDLRVTQSLIWGRSGTVSGPRLHLYIDGLLVISSSGLIASTIGPGAEVVINTKNAFYQSYFYVHGILRIAKGAILRLQAPSDLRYYRTPGTVVNEGRLMVETQSIGNYYARVTPYLDNEGELYVRTGRLVIDGYAGQIAGGLGGVIRANIGSVLQIGGTTVIAANATLKLDDATLRLYSNTYLNTRTSVSVSYVQCYAGTFYVSSPAGLTVLNDMTIHSTVSVTTKIKARRMFLNGGYLKRQGSNATISVYELQCTYGTISSSTAKVTDFWLTITGPLFISQSTTYIRACGILSSETTTITAGGRIYLQSSAVFRNDGNLTIDQSNFQASSGKLINFGNINVVVGASSTVSISGELSNYGRLTSVSGRLQLYKTTMYRNSVLIVQAHAEVQFASGNSRFLAGSILDVPPRASITVTSGTLEFLTNSTATQFSKLTVRGGNAIAHRGSAITKLDYLSNTGGSLTLNNSIVVTKAELYGGTTTIGGKVIFNQLLAKAMTLQGGRQQERAILEVNDFIFSSGTIKTWASTGRYFIVNVTNSMLIDSHDRYYSLLYHYYHSLDRCDLINYGTVTATSANWFYLNNGARFINAVTGTMILKYATHFYGWTQGTLLNYGSMSIGSFDTINLYVQLVIAGGTVTISKRQLILRRGGSCTTSNAAINIETDGVLQVSGGVFQCRPSVIQGSGTLRVTSGSLQLTSGRLNEFTDITSGTLQIPAGQNVEFSRGLRLASGTLNVDGVANFSFSMEFESGRMTGKGAVIVAKQGRMTTTGYIYNGRWVYVQIQNHGLMDISNQVYFYVIVRNEKSGTTQLSGTTRIHGSTSSGGFDNFGRLICNAHFGAFCYITIPFRIYRRLELQSGELRVTYAARLVDGCNVTGPGQLTSTSVLYVGGSSYSAIRAQAGIYVTAPFFSYGTFTWLSGDMQSATDHCFSPYSASNPYLNPLCEEVYFMNEGSMVIDGNSYKTLHGKTLFINQGKLSWDPYRSFTLAGTFVNAQRGVCTFSRVTGYTPSIAGSGNITNYGTFNINWTTVYMNYITFKNYGSFNLKQSWAYFSYKTFTQDGENSTINIQSQGLRARDFQLRNGILQGYGAIVGTVTNTAATIEPILSIDDTQSQLTMSSYTQTNKGKLKVALGKRNGRLVSGLLAVQQTASLTGTLQVTWDGKEVTDRDVNVGPLPAFISYKTRNGNFSDVDEIRAGILTPQLAVSFNSTHGSLKLE